MGPGRTGGRQGLWSLAATTVFTVVGASLIGVALISQEHPPSPSPGARPSTSPRPKVEARDATLTRSEPVSLDIPAIGVHSSVWQVGLDEEGAIQVPAPGPHYNDAAWY